MTLAPAYGRDYQNSKDLLADWEADKDFKVVDFTYRHQEGSNINKEDVETSFPGLQTITFRYKKLTMVFVHPVNQKKGL